MPIPAILAAIWGILGIIATAATVHELLSLMEDFYEDYSKYSGSVEEARKALRQLIDKLRDEIAAKVGEYEEVTFLIGESARDPQGPMTKPASGFGSGAPIINAAIEQKIPFRKIISEVCDHANRLPVPSLRKKKGVELKDLPAAKKKALLELLRLSAEELAHVDLDNLIVVRMRQLAVSLMFEFIDKMLDWQSPMKAEVSFGPKPGYEDHPAGSAATQLRRDGVMKTNPFYPGPFFRQRGSLTADLVITERRRRRCDKNNLFAIVEIKFPGDRIDARQFEAYRFMLEAAADVKTANAPVRHQQRKVNSGGRLSLFRYPIDRAVQAAEEKKPTKPSSRRRKG